jgi:uncharacterized protein with ParB-like and HNH nuclease domain
VDCCKLFSDIEAIAKGGKNHFVGTIVYVTSDKTNATWSEFTIIDGQQRITTVMLLLKAIHDLEDDKRTKDKIWKTYLTNEYADDEKYRLKLKPIESDSETWSAVIDGQSPKSKSSKLWKNYELFAQKILDSEYTPQEIFEAIGKLEIVYIQLETGKENPQIIFESINSTGVNLTQGDLIRNFLLMNCESQENQTRLYKNYWVKIEQFLTSSVIPAFVRDYLTMKAGRLVKKDTEYETFKTFFKANFDGAEEDSLRELCRFAEYYSWFRLCKSDDSKLNFLLRQFHEIKSTVAFNVMLWLLDKCFYETKLSKEQLYETLQILLCFQYRRSVCKYSTNALNKIYTVLPKGIGDSNDIPSKLFDILTQKTKTQTFPRNDEFRSAFISFDFYSAKLAKYTLSMLENNLNSKEQVSLTEQITIEHIMPQKLTPTWNAELGKNFGQIHEEWLHTIGNLTLSGSNSELGNKPFSEKKITFSQSNFALSREVARFLVWEENSIKDRANDLVDLALEIWSLPEKYNKEASNKEVIDYLVSYNIMQVVKVTGEKPRSYWIDDEENSVDTWKALFLGILKDLYELDPAVFDKLIKHETFIGRHLLEPVDSGYQYRSRSEDEICPGYYTETGYSAQDLVTFTQIAAEIYGLQDEIYFTLKSKTPREYNKGSEANPHDIEHDFMKWFTANGRTQNTANQYSVILRETTANTFDFQGAIKTNLFEYTTSEEFEVVNEQIQSLLNFVDVNRQSHNRFSAALKAYTEYLNS